MIRLRVFLLLLAVFAALGLVVTVGAWPDARPQNQAASTPIPSLISYQGRISVTGSLYNGTGYFTFTVVNAGGTEFWSSGAVSLTVVNGYFATNLGSTNPLNSSVFANSDRLLRVWFSTDGVTYEQLSPDTQFTSVPFAHVAQRVVETAVPPTPQPTATPVALQTPQSVSVSSVNSGTSLTHTHAVTSSSNPSATAQILSTDSSGYLQLVRLGLGVAPYFQFRAYINWLNNVAYENGLVIRANGSNDANTGYPFQIMNSVGTTVFSFDKNWNLSTYGGYTIVAGNLGVTGNSPLSAISSYSASAIPGIQRSFVFGRNPSAGTPINGFGTGLDMQLKDSTTASVSAAAIDWAWVESTHATRTSKIVFSDVSTATLTERATLDYRGLSVNGDVLPYTTTQNLGSSALYWNDVHYHNLVSHSIGDLTNGVTMQDGKFISCTQALAQMRATSTIMKNGLSHVDTASVPKIAVVPARDTVINQVVTSTEVYAGPGKLISTHPVYEMFERTFTTTLPYTGTVEIVRCDKEPDTLDTYSCTGYERGKWLYNSYSVEVTIKGEPGVDMDALQSVVLCASKELTARAATLDARIRALETRLGIVTP